MAATRIGIITDAQDTVTVAFYYPIVAPQNPKPTFVPAFPNLPAADILACQSGALFEVVKSFSYSGWTIPNARADLQAQWAAGQADALVQNGKRQTFAGKFWDGATWA